MGRCRCRRTDAARRATAAMARSEPRRDRIEPRQRMRVLVTNGVLPSDLVTRNRRIAEAALRPWTRVFTHGDLQITHVFVDGDEITGVVDWSEAAQGDALYDLASLTLGHQEHLADVVAGYGAHVNLDVIYAWWSLRSLRNGWRFRVEWCKPRGHYLAYPFCGHAASRDPRGHRAAFLRAG
ncbi:MAG: phosphotransferase family protein, partial [Longimicrobiales bacterium]